MARYDRIARLACPARDEAFDGWLSLRDLEGREREPELGRRAMARFLVLRPVRRLLLQGLDGPSVGSLTTQIDSVRERLDQLAGTDLERDQLAEYLEEVGGRSRSGLVRATAEVGASAEAAGHLYSAEEFYRTALELAEGHDLDTERIALLRHIGRIHRERREWQAAMEALEESARLAESLESPVEWARSREAMAGLLLRRGRPDEARATLAEITDASRASDETVRAVAAAGRCALELGQENPERAIDAGWEAIQLLDPGDEARNQVLLNTAAAFRRLGLREAAASCYGIVERWAAWPEHRIEARLECALVSAESGDGDQFLRLRSEVLDSLVYADRPLKALVHLGLGRGALLVEGQDHAREHLRQAISLARDLEADEILERAESLLDVLEDSGRIEPPRTPAPGPESRQIGQRVEELAREVAHAAG